MSNNYESFLKIKPYIAEMLPTSNVSSISGTTISMADVNAALAAHVALSNPHSQYLTITNTDTRYYTKVQSDARFALQTISLTGTGALGGGGTIAANRTITLNTPGTLTVSTTNASSTNHTHAITASANVSAGVESLLKSTAGGGLTLATLTTSGVINAAINTDTAHRLGNAVVGYTGASTYAGFAAYGFNTATDYAIMQSSGGGDVFLNVPSSGIGHIRAGAFSDIFTWSSGGLTSVGSAYIASDNYVSGWAGSGFRIDQNLSVVSSSFAEFDNLSIRGTMSVYELLINQIRATNGTLFVTASGKIESISGSVWTLEDPTGNSLCPFAVNDLVIIQRVDTNSTTIVQRIVRRVISVTGKSITVATASGGPVDTGTVAVGDTVVRFGNSATAARQGSVLLTSDMSNSPYIDIINGVTSWADWTGGTKTKMRIGLLTGVTGISNEYGFVAGNGFTTADSYIKASSTEVTQNNVNSTWYSSGVPTIKISSGYGIDLKLNESENSYITWRDTIGTGTAKATIAVVNSTSSGMVIQSNIADATKESIAWIVATNSAATTSSCGLYLRNGLSGAYDSYAQMSAKRFAVGYTNYTYFTTAWSNLASTNHSEISNDLGTFKALMLAGNKSLDSASRLVNVYDKLYVSSILEVGQARTTGNVSLFTGRNSTTSSISLTATSWGNGAAIGFNAYHANDSITPVASGAFKFLGTQYTGNITRPGMQFWDGNSGTFAWYYGEAALASGANITTWTKSFQINTTNVIAYNPVIIQAATGQYELLRLYGGGTGAGNAAYIGFYDNAGTTRYGYVGDPSTGNSDFTVHAELGALNLGDSGNSSAITISSGHTKIAGNIGFNNTTPIAKPTVTGSRGGNAALASLLTALANYGLITNSTTA